MKSTIKYLLLIVLFSLSSHIFLPTPLFAQQKEIIIEHRDCDITILSNGDVQFVETWEVRFLVGRFSRVMHTISHEHITGITGWEVHEGGSMYKQSDNDDPINYEPNSYTVRRNEKSTSLTWYFPKTQSRSRTFVIKYTLQGAMRIHPGFNDQFFWTLFEKNHDYSFTSSQVTVHLPKLDDSASIQASSYRNQERDTKQPKIDGQTVTFEGGPFDSGTSWDIHVQFPHGALTALRPVWQTSIENALADPKNAATVEQRKSDITITSAGDVRVQDTWTLNLTGGPFSNASFEIPHQKVSHISDWGVSESGTSYVQGTNHQPSTFDTVSDDQKTRITWYFSPTTNTTRTFTIDYILHGALHVGTEKDRLFWDVSQTERAYVIDTAQVQIHLPSTFDPKQIDASYVCNKKVTLEIATEPGVVVLTGGHFDRGTACELNVAFPHGVVPATPPAWQSVVGEEEQKLGSAANQAKPSQLIISIGIVVLLLAVIGLAYFWHRLPK